MAEFDSIINFIEAHDIALQVMKKIIGDIDIYDHFQREVYAELKAADTYLTEVIKKSFPDVIVAIQQRRATT